VGEPVTQLLFLIAQLAIATVALSGITMLIGTSSLRLTFERVVRIRSQLNMASVVAVFAVVPLCIDQLGISESAVWRIASGLYLMTVCALVGAGVRKARSEKKVPVMTQVLLVPGLGGLILLPLNIVFVSVWPYLFQLLIAWTVSLILFLLLMGDILEDKAKNDSA
jgi:hypothetical protein